MDRNNAIEKLERIKKKIGDTPLVELTQIEIERDCRILVKEEYKNPSQSHYDRQTADLLIDALKRGQFLPGEKVVVESTTGSSGASFAWMCKCIGAKATVLIPDEMPLSRKKQIEAFGAQLIETEKGKYVNGVLDVFQTWYRGERSIEGLGMYDSNKHLCLNHAYSRIGPKMMRPMWEEICEEVQRITGGKKKLGYFITALGNGTSISGIAADIKKYGAKIVGFEPYNSPSVMKKKYPERYAKIFGNNFPKESHEIIGTGPGENVEFPSIKHVVNMLSDVVLVSDEDMRDVQKRLHFDEFILAGNSSAAAVHAARVVAKGAKPGSIICTIAYDPAWRYIDGGDKQN